jgi:predicted nucleotidyltransferase
MPVINDIIAPHATQLAALCRRLGVRRLELFGSATTEHFDLARSDLDFLYEFEDLSSPALADRFFELWEGLEALFARKVDLVSARSIRNPYFLRKVNEQRRVLYAA